MFFPMKPADLFDFLFWTSIFRFFSRLPVKVLSEMIYPEYPLLPSREIESLHLLSAPFFGNILFVAVDFVFPPISPSHHVPVFLLANGFHFDFP